MKEGTAFHSPKDEEQKAFERRTATNSALFWTDADFSMQCDAVHWLWSAAVLAQGVGAM